MRCAVIDLGTNTFHLLISEQTVPGGAWTDVYRERIYVKLAEEGIEQISAEAFRRAVKAIVGFGEQLEAAEVPLNRIRAIGTAALRTAQNAPHLVDTIYAQTGIRVEIISGDREAELIYKGVRQAVPFPENLPGLIMDIGGGSVEFILVEQDRVVWAQSFPIGVAILRKNFPHSEPIAASEIQQIEEFLETALSDLWQAMSGQVVPALIGASGTFDVIDLFLMDPDEKHPLFGYIRIEQFEPLYEKFIQSNMEERYAMEGLPPERVEMIIVAIILIRKVLHRIGISEIYTSTYALKEGILDELRS